MTTEMTIEQIEALAASIVSSTKKEESSWMNGFERDKKGKIDNSINNYIYYLENCPKYVGKLKYNDYKKKKEFDDKEFTDFTQDIIYNDIERDINLTSRTKIDSALMEIFDKNRYNPIIEYLDSLEWDKTCRIENIFQQCFDIDDTKLVRAMAKKWFIAAVKRTYEPGCKFDNMIVIQGGQGIGKSTFCSRLAKGNSTDISFDEINNKDIINKLNQTWIGIIDEMDNYGKKEMGSIKTFLSKTKDEARLAYAKNIEEFQRHCVFIGSLNDETFLRDITSSVERRFWIFRANKQKWDGTLNKILTNKVVDQLWAEAVYYYKENKDYYLDIDAELMEDFAKDQRQFKTFNDDMSVEYIKNILNSKYRLSNDGEFINDSDFKDQIMNSNLYERTSYINVIPRNYITYALKSKYGVERNFKFISQAISDEWEEKQKTYNGIRGTRCFVRKEQIENINNESEIFDEIFQ